MGVEEYSRRYYIGDIRGDSRIDFNFKVGGTLLLLILFTLVFSWEVQASTWTNFGSVSKGMNWEEFVVAEKGEVGLLNGRLVYVDYVDKYKEFVLVGGRQYYSLNSFVMVVADGRQRGVCFDSLGENIFIEDVKRLGSAGENLDKCFVEVEEGKPFNLLLLKTSEVSEKGLNEELAMQIVMLDRVFRNSGIGLDFKVVGVGNWEQKVKGMGAEEKARLAVGDAKVKLLEKELGVDCVVIVDRDNSENIIGLGTIFNEKLLNKDNYRKRVWMNINGRYFENEYNSLGLLAHEIGHVFGAGHGEMIGSNANEGMGYKEMAGGYKERGKYSIMLYNEEGTTLLPYLSENAVYREWDFSRRVYVDVRLGNAGFDNKSVVMEVVRRLLN